jgi:hypothetical protein
MVNLSAEQSEIIKTVLSKKNCLVDAVAGSGKTTTVMGLAETDTSKQILQITYNRHLKDEVKEKAKTLTNMTVYTYHGLCVKYYNNKAHTDAFMKLVLHKDTKVRHTIPDFDILVIDEAQDMNLLFFHFIRKFLRDYGKPVTILVLGDKYQSINEFRGADRRFLTLAADLYKNYGEFVNLTLKTSYRLTNQIASFINSHMLGESRIHTVRDGPRVEFMRNSVWTCDRIIEKVVKLLDSKRYLPGDIFILAGTTRSKRDVLLPTNYLEQALVSRKIPCFGTNDDEELSTNLTDGKVVFSTIHQSKGRERPIVIVYGFDSNWFSFFGRDLNRKLCPSELYVATTRASELLMLIEGSDTMPLEFLKERIRFSAVPYINYYQSSNVIKDKVAPKPLNTNPTDMLRHMNEEVMYVLLQIKELIFKCISYPSKKVDIPSVTKNNIETCENISDLNGLCIPAMWEENMRGTSNIKNDVIHHMTNDNPKPADILLNAYRKINIKTTNISDYLLLTNIYQSINTNYHFKIAQIENYDWLTGQMIEECHKSMSKYIGKNPEFEHSISNVIYHLKDHGPIRLNCRLDAFDDIGVWEFKCVSSLQLEHFLQLVIYAWLWTQPQGEEGELQSNLERYGSRKFHLMNIRTEEVHELDTSSPYIKEVVDILLENKYKLCEKISNEVFIKRCLEPLEIKKTTGEGEGEVLSLKTIPELQMLCREYGIRGTTKVSKRELIEKIDSYKRNGLGLDNMTLQELHDLCNQASMIGYKKKSKMQLIELLKPK